MSRRSLRRAILWCSLGVTGCFNDCQEYDIHLALADCGPAPMAFGVGDTIVLQATATAQDMTTYSTLSTPARFVWYASPPGSALIQNDTLLIFQKPGRPVLRVQVGISMLEVELRVDSVARTVDVRAPISVRRGETLSVQFTAWDTTGIGAAPPWPPYIEPRPGRFFKRIALDAAITSEARFQATQAGNATLRWCFNHRAGTTSIKVLP